MSATEEERTIMRYLQNEWKEDLKWLRKRRDELVAWLQADSCVDDTKISEYIEARDQFLNTRAMYDSILENIAERESNKI